MKFITCFVLFVGGAVLGLVEGDEMMMVGESRHAAGVNSAGWKYGRDLSSVGEGSARQGERFPKGSMETRNYYDDEKRRNLDNGVWRPREGGDERMEERTDEWKEGRRRSLERQMMQNWEGVKKEQWNSNEEGRRRRVDDGKKWREDGNKWRGLEGDKLKNEGDEQKAQAWEGEWKKSEARQLGGRKHNNSPTIVINGAGGGMYGYGYAAPAPMHIMHTRVPSTRVASLETRSAPIAVAERPVLIAPGSQPVCSTSSCAPTVATVPSVVVERQAVTQIIREKSCPQNMELSRDGLSCVGLDICPVTYTCPPGHVERGHQCVTIQQPFVECEEFSGAELRNGRCVSTEIFPAEMTCRDSRFQLDPISNVCVQTIEQPPKCPPGFQFNRNGECSQLCPSQPSCPPGYSLSVGTRECVRTVSEPAQHVCPEGAYPKAGNSESCVITRQDPPRCPPRFTFDAQQQTCVHQIPKVPVECPYGHNRVGMHCERTERDVAELSCPPGYDLGYDNVCTQSIEVEPSCPVGFVHSGSVEGQCEKCVKEQPQCPVGTKQVGYGSSIRCETEVERPGNECCAPGFNLEGGMCRRVEVLAPTLSCENQCYTVTDMAVAFACPAGSEFVDHPQQPRCVRTVTVQKCDRVAPPSIRCMEEIRSQEGQEDLRQHEQMVYNERMNTAEGIASIVEGETTEESSHSNTRSGGNTRALGGVGVGGICTPVPPPSCRSIDSSESLPAEPYCPNGGKLEGRRCVTREPVIPVRICKVGQLDEITGQCTREVVTPVKTECPPGSVRRGMKCIAIESVSPQFVCPQGSEMGVNGICVEFRPMIVQPPKISRVPAVPRCSSGTLSGRECLKSFRQPVEMNCPAGSVESSQGIMGGCFVTAELTVPPPVEKAVRPSLVCPPGSVLNGKVCVNTERMSADEMCPTGTVQMPDGCHRVVAAIYSEPRVQTQAAAPVCRDGSSVRGTSCVRTTESEAQVRCPAGFSLEVGQCIRAVEKTPLCPAGTELQGGGCVRPVTVPPTIRIVNGCVNEIVRECESCPAQVKEECHSGHF